MKLQDKKVKSFKKTHPLEKCVYSTEALETNGPGKMHFRKFIRVQLSTQQKIHLNWGRNKNYKLKKGIKEFVSTVKGLQRVLEGTLHLKRSMVTLHKPRKLQESTLMI